LDIGGPRATRLCAIKIRFNLAVEATTDGDLKPEASKELKKALDEVSDASH